MDVAAMLNTVKQALQDGDADRALELVTEAMSAMEGDAEGDKSARRGERKGWSRIIDEAERLSNEARRDGGDDVLSRAESLLERAEDMDLPEEGSREADEAYSALDDLRELVDELREQARMPSRSAGWDDDEKSAGRRGSKTGDRRNATAKRAPGAHLLYA